MPCIYLFYDTRYEHGVKVGRCGSANGLNAWRAAPSYSPAPMHYLAGWKVEGDYSCTDGTRHATVASLEAHVHANCGPRICFPRSGREWFDLSPLAAINRITVLFGREPDILNGHCGITVTNDNLRNPHPRRLPAYPLKVAVWVYREHLTERLKTQFVDDWASPRETSRRYSRNGFAEVAAFTYSGPPSAESNVAIHRAWTEIMTVFGPGPDDKFYGWLRPGAELRDVSAQYQRCGLTELDHTSQEAPPGIRRRYNRAD